MNKFLHLQKAIIKNNISKVKMLLDDEIIKNDKLKYLTSLHYERLLAVNMGNIEIIKLLCNTEYDMQQALKLAIFNKNIKLIKLLLPELNLESFDEEQCINDYPLLQSIIRQQKLEELMSQTKLLCCVKKVKK